MHIKALSGLVQGQKNSAILRKTVAAETIARVHLIVSPPLGTTTIMVPETTGHHEETYQLPPYSALNLF